MNPTQYARITAARNGTEDALDRLHGELNGAGLLEQAQAVHELYMQLAEAAGLKAPRVLPETDEVPL